MSSLNSEKNNGNNMFRGWVLPHAPHALESKKICSHCGAVRFQFESEKSCCLLGHIKLAQDEPPDELCELYYGTSSLSDNFRRYIRIYNSSFAFTSLGVHLDQRLLKEYAGVYTFRVQGQLYHTIKPLVPGDNNPSALQLYYYDTEHELQNRLDFSNSMLPAVLEILSDVMQGNPYARFLKSLKQIPNINQCSISIAVNPELDQRVYNTPSVSQVAAMWVEDGIMGDNFSRQIILHGKDSISHTINCNYGCYDPLQYPLIFARGESGWHPNVSRYDANQTNVIRDDETVQQFLDRQRLGSCAGSKRGRVTCMDYYRYKLQIRPTLKTLLLHVGRLLQQFVVDMYIKIETGRLEFLRHNQKKLRADWFQGVLDSVQLGFTHGADCGKRIMLPATFIGGPRDMQARYLDAMALVRKFGKPDFFITITCNPNWLEIKNELLPFELTQNRPDLTTRIFRAKVEELKKDIIDRALLGPVAAYAYVIEFQKRGLPHAHFLVVLQSGAKIKSTEQVDKFVSAQIPDALQYPYLHSLIVKHMMHGPCGILNPKNVCMNKHGCCKDDYPKHFAEETQFGEDSFPLYMRTCTGPTVCVRQQQLNNRWVVPYNPYLLAKYDCHLNVEVCSSIKAVKYLYKYMYKGHDRVSFSLDDDGNQVEVDEIREFQQARWISPPEATWRIFGFTLNEMYPSVYSLQVHLPGYHSVAYSDSTSLSYLLSSESTSKSMLTEFFILNQKNSIACSLLYKEIPEFFVWDSSAKNWRERKQRMVIGRLTAVAPAEGERYYLRLLLAHVRGARSFEELRTVEGHLCDTFREACLQRGFLQNDEHYNVCFQEAANYGMPSQLRQLFAVILALCSPQNPKLMWFKFKNEMSSDYLQRGYNQVDSERMALVELQHMLESMGRDINDFCLISGRVEIGLQERTARVIDEEKAIPIFEYDLSAVDSLNDRQRQIYHKVMESVIRRTPLLLFVDGPGGTGKTFLYRTLLAHVRARGLIALATASSGVAAGILPGGRTAHYRFKLPLDAQESMQCNVTKQSALASLLKLSTLIIWDEAPMMHRYCIESVDRLFRDLTGSILPFGGKIVVLGGDFRQVLPVIPKGTRQDTCNACLVNSFLWNLFEKHQLIDNMRARSDHSYSDYLLRIGNGVENIINGDTILIPEDLLLTYEDEATSLKKLISQVFPHVDSLLHNDQQFIGRVILTPTNQSVDHINELLIETFSGEVHTYYSYDNPLESTEYSFEVEFLNTLAPKGIPPHELKLKINCPIILLRNINCAEGLANGTRLICKKFHPNLIEAVISSGEQRGKTVLLPRIPFIPSETQLCPYAFKRTQFPIRLCFAMTINKSQGQTLDYVGLYLREPVFSHGQLYVALSRVRNRESIKILLCPTLLVSSVYHTKNIVYHEVLQHG